MGFGTLSGGGGLTVRKAGVIDGSGSTVGWAAGNRAWCADPATIGPGWFSAADTTNGTMVGMGALSTARRGAGDGWVMRGDESANTLYRWSALSAAHPPMVKPMAVTPISALMPDALLARGALGLGRG